MVTSQQVQKRPSSAPVAGDRHAHTDEQREGQIHRARHHRCSQPAVEPDLHGGLRQVDVDHRHDVIAGMSLVAGRGLQLCYRRRVSPSSLPAVVPGDGSEGSTKWPIGRRCGLSLSAPELSSGIAGRHGKGEAMTGASALARHPGSKRGPVSKLPPPGGARISQAPGPPVST